MKPAKRFVSGLPPCASSASRPRKGALPFIFTAQPSPASKGVSLGVMSDAQAR